MINMKSSVPDIFFLVVQLTQCAQSQGQKEVHCARIWFHYLPNPKGHVAEFILLIFTSFLKIISYLLQISPRGALTGIS